PPEPDGSPGTDARGVQPERCVGKTHRRRGPVGRQRGRRCGLRRVPAVVGCTPIPTLAPAIPPGGGAHVHEVNTCVPGTCPFGLPPVASSSFPGCPNERSATRKRPISTP